MESWVKSMQPQNISGASGWDSVAAEAIKLSVTHCDLKPVGWKKNLHFQTHVCVTDGFELKIDFQLVSKRILGELFL